MEVGLGYVYKYSEGINNKQGESLLKTYKWYSEEKWEKCKKRKNHVEYQEKLSYSKIF